MRFFAAVAAKPPFASSTRIAAATSGIYAVKKRFGPPFSGKFRKIQVFRNRNPTSHIGYISKKSESGNGFMEKIPTFFG